jgi:Spy/CpxP family protein refolding chaperone
MKNILLLGLVAVALMFSACNKNTGINAPAGGSPSTFMKAADQMNLTNDQLAVVDVMYYMGEDMSIVLSPAQLSSYNIVLGKLEPTLQGGTPGATPPRGFADMAAIQYYNLILKANPALDQATKDALKQLLQDDAQTRAGIIKNNQNDPATMKQLLQDEHTKLMDAMNALLTPDQIQAVSDLQAKIDQQRQAMQAKLLELRINSQIQMLTKILTLTTDQQTQIHDILKGQATQIDVLRQQYKNDPEGFRTALQALQTQTDAAIYALLTPDQQLKWDAWKKGVVIKPPQMDPIQAQVAQWTKILTLTTDQQTQLTTILTDQTTQQQALMTQYKTDPKGLRAALDALQQATDAKIVAMLTPDQLIIWNKMHGKGDPGNGGGKNSDPIQQQVNDLTKDLGLTPDQATQVYPILQQQNTDMQTIMQQYKNDPVGLKQALADEQTKINGLMQGVLTADQYAKWLKLPTIGGVIHP